MLTLPAWHTALAEEMLGYPLTSSNIRRHLVPNVQKLSEWQRDYTSRKDEQHAQYLRTPAIRDAYFAYFTTVNMLKLYRPLSELHESGFFLSSRSVLDLGCGTATAYLGLAGWLEEMGIDSAVHYHATDVLPENTAFTQSVHRSMHQTGHTRIESFTHSLLNIERPVPLNRQYDLIIMMNVLNEASSESYAMLYDWLAEHLLPDGAVILVEPALKSISRNAIRTRRDMSKQNWTIYAPCFRQQFCPALKNPRDWCHAEDNWDRPPHIEEIDSHAGLVKLSLKYTYFILNRNGATLRDALMENAPLCRSVSETFKEKGRTRVYLCGKDGRDEYLLNHRDKKAANKRIQKLHRFDIVSVENTERRKDDVLVGKNSIITPVRSGFDDIS